MIICVTCACGGAEPLARRTFRAAGLKDWLTRPIYSGRDETIKVLNHVFGEQFPAIQGLRQYISESSSYVVIIGANAKKAIWADIGRGDIKSEMDAIAIIDAFAD